MTTAPNLLDHTPAMAAAELRAWVEAHGLPAYRGEQLARRLWQNPVATWSEATELPADLRKQLDIELPLARLETEVVQTSSDGTRKYLWKLPDGEKIESVLIPTATRRTLCISSQAGKDRASRPSANRPSLPSLRSRATWCSRWSARIGSRHLHSTPCAWS